MELWRETWRRGFAPNLTTDVLREFASALRVDDPRLLQGCTTKPPPLESMQDFPVEGGCALGFCGAIANGGFDVATVGVAEEFFARACFETDAALGDAACRHFLNWFDDTPRDEMRRELLSEVELVIRERESAAA